MELGESYGDGALLNTKKDRITSEKTLICLKES